MPLLESGLFDNCSSSGSNNESSDDAPKSMPSTPVFPQRTPAPRPPAGSAKDTRALQNATAPAPAAPSSWIAAWRAFLTAFLCSNGLLTARDDSCDCTETEYKHSEGARVGMTNNDDSTLQVVLAHGCGYRHAFRHTAYTQPQVSLSAALKGPNA